MQFRHAIQTVVLAAMAELELDAFVAPTNNQPPPLLQSPRPLGKHKRPDVWSFLGGQGIPNITVPAGFTTVVYDRVRDPSVDPDTLEPPGEPASSPGGTKPYADTRAREGYRLERSAAALPIGLDVMARPFDEPVMLRVAAAFEAATSHRVPPPDFGPL
jgi:Asp-tRNA(Asn)/Glu-tRNA(Gln) amidotransferase A subunit family amidase